MHRSHGVGDLVEYEVHFTFDLMTVGDTTDELLYDLHVAIDDKRIVQQLQQRPSA